MKPIWDYPPEAVLEKLLKDIIVNSSNKRIEGSENLRLFLNDLYKKADLEMQQLLSSREPAAWIRVAMEQLVMWSFIYRDDKVGAKKEEGETAPLSLAPIGRYGWRYIIDVSFRHITSSSKVFCGIPDEEDILQAFYLMTIMSSSSEWSNFFHYFGREFPYFYTELKPLSSVLMPQLMPEHDQEFQSRILYVGQKPAFQNSEEIYPDITSGKYAQILDAVLQTNLGFSVSDFDRFLNALIEIAPPYVLVIHSRKYLSEWIAYISGMEIKRVNNIIDFAFLSKSKLPNASRDFLKRSDMLRMSNFAGIILPRICHLDVLYNLSDLRREVLTDNEHLIISAPMFAEWIDNLSNSLVHGVRTDLKEISWFRPALNKLEQYYTKQVFEGVLAELYKEMGYWYIWGLKELSTGKLLSCGEIDLLAYNPLNNTLHIVEAKAIAGVINFRNLHQIYKDHFTQKKYHQKFLSKIAWVKANRETIGHEFKHKCNIEIQPDFSVCAKFVTKSRTILKFYVTEYEILSYEELQDSFRSPRSEV